MVAEVAITISKTIQHRHCDEPLTRHGKAIGVAWEKAKKQSSVKYGVYGSPRLIIIGLAMTF